MGKRVWPRGVSIARHKDGWEVRIGKSVTGGPILRRFFRSRQQAELWAKEKIEAKEEHGYPAFSLSEAEFVDARHALALLNGQTSLCDCAKYWIERAKPKRGAKTFTDIASEFLRSRTSRNCRDRTISQYSQHLGIICEEFGQICVHELDREAIQEWLEESPWAARTRLNYLKTLSTLCRFAVRSGYCLENPAERVERPILDDRPPGILSVEQCRALLMKAKKNDPDFLPAVAIGLFAGLRRSEICALEWTEIDMKSRTIEVKRTQGENPPKAGRVSVR